MATIHHVQLPQHRLNRVSEFLYRHRYEGEATSHEASRDVIKVVCIADTHNLEPSLPPGDLLVHAGDLTEWDTFDQVQAQLHWLSSQPHQHKLVIAGNHDLLFDEAFLDAHPEHRAKNNGRTFRQLDFGTVTYLQDQSVTIDFPDKNNRRLKVFGSPWTPQYGTSAFQHPRDADKWKDCIPRGTDMVISHGPPAAHLCGKLHSGCESLLQELGRVRPALVVFGHIHMARGQELVVLDLATRLHDDITLGRGGWPSVVLLGLAVACSWLRVLPWLSNTNKKGQKATRLVNAAMLKGDNQAWLGATVVDV